MQKAFDISFPGDLDYIPAIRKYVSELLVASNCTPKFAYRSEVIIDELCNNAVTYGCLTLDANVRVHFEIFHDRIEFVIRDEGGRKEDLQRLDFAVQNKPRVDGALRMAPGMDPGRSFGLELVRMLSDKVHFEIDGNNLTTVRVVKLREEKADDDGGCASS